LPNLFEDESNKRSVEALLKQLMLMKIMEDVHKVILHYIPKEKKKKEEEEEEAIVKPSGPTLCHHPC